MNLEVTASNKQMEKSPVKEHYTAKEYEKVALLRRYILNHALKWNVGQMYNVRCQSSNKRNIPSKNFVKNSSKCKTSTSDSNIFLQSKIFHLMTNSVKKICTSK